MAFTLIDATRNALADQIDTSLSTAATLKVYTGAAPAVSAVATGTLLVTFALNNPAFGAAAAGVITLDTTGLTATPAANGVAGYFRIENAAATQRLQSADIGTSGNDLTLDTTTLDTGVDVTITAGTFTVPAS